MRRRPARWELSTMMVTPQSPEPSDTCEECGPGDTCEECARLPHPCTDHVAEFLAGIDQYERNRMALAEVERHRMALA